MALCAAAIVAGGCSKNSTVEVRAGKGSLRTESSATAPWTEIPAGEQKPYETVMSNPLHDEQWMLKPTGSGSEYQWVAVKTQRASGERAEPAKEATAGEMYVEEATTLDGVRTGPVYVKTVKQLVAEANNKRDAVVRMDAIAALAKAQFGGEKQYLAMYRSALARDPDIGVRVAAVRALGQHGEGEDLAKVDALAKSANSVMRAAAERAAIQIRGRTAQ
jgi:hypothetical protein